MGGAGLSSSGGGGTSSQGRDPGSALATLGRKHGGAVVIQAAYAFICEIHRDSQTGLLHKPALYAAAVIDAVPGLVDSLLDLFTRL